MFIAPLPRGVKEYSHDDLETIPGTSLIFKKETVWPPPPVEKGLSVSSELCVCKIGICFKVFVLRMRLHSLTSLSIYLYRSVGKYYQLKFFAHEHILDDL